MPDSFACSTRGAVSGLAHRSPRDHDDDEQRPVWHPAQPRRSIGKVPVLRSPVTALTDRVGGRPVEVGVPQPLSVRAEPLGRVDPIDEQLPSHVAKPTVATGLGIVVHR